MHVFLFDIDGTLISSGGAGQAALYGAMTTEFGVDAPKSVPIHGLTDRTIASSLFEQHGIENSHENFKRLIRSYLELLPESLSKKQGSILAGVAELLELLAQRSNAAIGLLTGNVADGAKIKLNHFGLHHYFSFGGYGDHHHRREDVAAEAFQAAREHLNGSAVLERTYVIGDTPNDIRCAKHIGARVMAVCTGNYSADQLSQERPDWLVNDLSDPTDVLTLLDA